MNNDISRDISMYNSKQLKKQRVKNSANNENMHFCADIEKDNTSNLQEIMPMEASMGFLGNIGCAQVKMNNTIQDSVNAFLQDPLYAESYVEFYDSLIEKGYSANEALKISDDFFAQLKKANMYS